MAACPNLDSLEKTGLVYVTDDSPGITRQKSGKGFAYYNPDGTLIQSPQIKSRINALAIPPAYHNVWICPLDNGHIQATGRDDRDRKQYRYHPDWIALRDEAKFDKMVEFGKVLPKIRERVESDLRKHGTPRDKVLAAVVALLEKSLIRVGNYEYKRENQTYGLTTIHNNHALVHGASIDFHFPAKSGKEREVTVTDRKLANLVKRLQQLPGQELFGYRDQDGTVHDITSTDVNDYLHEIAGDQFTAKDFRTWAATREAFCRLAHTKPAESKTARKRQIVQIVKEVAETLGNTPAVAKNSYIHKQLLKAAEDQLPFKCKNTENPEPDLLKFLENLKP